jgi:hypothetical protein
MHGPYTGLDAALNAAAEASNREAELHIIDIRDLVKDMKSAADSTAVMA